MGLPVTASITIEIPGITPHELSKSYMGHWRKRHSAFQAAKQLAEILWGVAPMWTPSWKDIGEVEARPWGRVTVEYKSYWCGKKLDRDNLILRCSAYLDAAVSVGIIVDDASENVADPVTSYERVQHRSEAKTVVTIREVA